MANTTPLNQRDTIEVPRTHQNLINFRYILRTGKVPIGDSTHEKYSIDWNHKDGFTDAVRAIRARAQADIDRDPDLQDLLKKKPWTKEDREKWEEDVSNIIKVETAATPGLKDYRTVEKIDAASKNIKPLHRLNDLADDIDHNTETTRFDCGVETLVKGSVMQQLEDANLPSGDPHDFKTAQAYFFASSVMLDGSEPNGKPGGHAFLLAPSGNIVEETLNGDRTDYQRTMTPNTLETFIRGDGVEAQDGTYYGITNGSHPGLFGWSADEDAPKVGIDKVRDQTNGVAANQREEGVVFTKDQLFDRTRMKGFQAVEDKKHGMIMVVSAVQKNGHNEFELKLYQKQNVGSPQEGYVLVGYGHNEKKPGDWWQNNSSITVHYTDPLNGNRDYVADMDVTDLKNVKMSIAQRFSQQGDKGRTTYRYDYGVRETQALSNPQPGLSAQNTDPAVNSSVLTLAPVTPMFNTRAAVLAQNNAAPQSKFGGLQLASAVTAPDPTPRQPVAGFTPNSPKPA